MRRTVNRQVPGHNIKTFIGNEICKVVCMNGRRISYSYSFNVHDWRKSEDKKGFILRKIPQAISLTNGDLRERIIDAQLRAIIKVVNE
jgi:hypothetical protein